MPKTNKKPVPPKQPVVVGVAGLLDLPESEQDKILQEMIRKVDALFGVTPTPAPKPVRRPKNTPPKQ